MKLRLLAGLIAGLFSLPAFADQVTILHVNDVHSRIEPINKYNSNCDEEDDDAGKCFGGAARLATAIAAQRAAAEGPVLLLDAGDEFQGSLFFTQYQGQAASKMMNAMGFDAMAVGNHEFDSGPEVLRQFADSLEFPILMANAEIEPGSVLDGGIPASTVLEADGKRYGVIGLAPLDAAVLSSPGPTVTFTNPALALQKEIDALKADGVERIIVLSHLGLRVDKALAADVTGIDLIVGGHSHTLLSNTAENAAGPYPLLVPGQDGATPVVQVGAFGKYLGKIVLTFDDAGKVTAAEGNPILLDASVEQDADIDAKVKTLAKPLDAVRQKVVGLAGDVIDGSRESCRSGECAMGNLVADAMLDRVKGQGVTIAIQNGGGVRASFEKGEITMGDVITVLPFQNTLATFELTGAGVVEALENGVSQIEDGAGRFAQVAGLRYTADTSVPAGEGRIVKVEVVEDGKWVSIDPAATYKIVSNNYMRGGGDGYSVFTTAANAYDYGPGLESVFADYLNGRGEVVPVIDGRVTIK